MKGYFISVAYLGLNDEKEFKKSINSLISYGGYWSLLGHELRGHFSLGREILIKSRKRF